MQDNELICYKCKNEISDDFKKKVVIGNKLSERSIFSAYDSHRNDGADFCCLKCMRDWRTGKITSLTISLILCILVLIFVSIATESFAGIAFMFIPFMIRQWARGLSNVANSGWFGEFVSFFVVLIASFTLVYPIYKLVQEIIWLKRSGEDISQARSELLESLDLSYNGNPALINTLESATSLEEIKNIMQNFSN